VPTDAEIIANSCRRLTYFKDRITLRLNRLRDDGNLHGMLFKANHALEKVADYTKLPDGTWVVEVRQLKLRLTGPSPTDCRFRLLAEFDERVAKWIVAVTERGSSSKSQLAPKI
jgi:hypothetical protein